MCRFTRRSYITLTSLSIARLLTFHCAVYRRIGHCGSFEYHRSRHWHASSSGSRVCCLSMLRLFFRLLFHLPSSSAVLTIGAATLADIYEPHRRGTMMGVFYSAPLLGPALGAILGGGLTQGFSWRAIFWFLVIWGGVMFSAFLFLFKDTFRKERSTTYQTVLKRRLLAQEKDTTPGEPPIGENKTSKNGMSRTQALQDDIEAQPAVPSALAIKEINLSFADVNPLPPYLWILRRKNNLCILLPSGAC